MPARDSLIAAISPKLGSITLHGKEESIKHNSLFEMQNVSLNKLRESSLNPPFPFGKSLVPLYSGN